MDINEIYKLEVEMWEAAKSKSPVDFLKVVSESAVMVCGGYRCTGKEYADIVEVFDCKAYKILGFEIVSQEENLVQTHYLITLEVNDKENEDLAGTFHITTTWKKNQGSWKVIFNMDQRIIYDNRNQ